MPIMPAGTVPLRTLPRINSIISASGVGEGDGAMGPLATRWLA
jgi:hypothetical protein